MRQIDVAIIGGGAAGIAAAVWLKEHGVSDVILFEKNESLGGILYQCIHSGFGLKTYQEELTGPEYAEREIRTLQKTGVDVKLETLVLEIDANNNLTYTNKEEGYQTISCQAILFSTGCIERTRYHIAIPGERPSGVLTAGLAQRYINIDGLSVGKDVFILGSGDIGLIMARRLKLEGANVIGVAEILPYSNGLSRNVVQCLHDFGIPLYLSHTVSNVFGKDRLTHIELSRVDENRQIIESSKQIIPCDTLLLSVGLIPSVTLLKQHDVLFSKDTNSIVVDESYMSTKEGIFACGNALHVHDLVDWVTEEARDAARAIKDYIDNVTIEKKEYVNVVLGGNIRYCVPHRVTKQEHKNLTLKFRVKTPQEEGKFLVYANEEIVFEKKLRYLLPSEMQQFTITHLPKEIDTLRIEVVV